ncbi:MAG: hypothetical protein JST05_00105 [Acidobacteria bacterium]|nr:hypothetical protein [Acidobacteriota bacterium]
MEPRLLLPPIVGMHANAKVGRGRMGSGLLVGMAFATISAFAQPVQASGPPHSNEAAREAIFNALTANTWTTADVEALAQKKPPTNPVMAAMSMMAESEVTTYRRDGTFQVKLVTDYVPSPTFECRWTLEDGPNGTHFLRMESGQRMRIELDSSGRLLLDGRPLQFKGTPILDRKGTAKDLKPLSLPAEAQLLMPVLSSHRWRLAMDLGKDIKPVLAEFKNDQTYDVIYADGRCSVHGRWWADRSSKWGPYIWKGITAEGTSDCLPRTDIRDFSRSLSIQLATDGSLLINGDRFVPETLP